MPPLVPAGTPGHEPAQEVLPVPVIANDGTPFNAPGCHVVHHANHVQPGRSRYGEALADPAPEGNTLVFLVLY